MTACGGADEAIDITAAPNDERLPLYNLAGFLSAIGLHDASMSDIWAWLQPFDTEDVADVFRHVALLAGVPLDRLASEAAALRQEIQSADGGGGFVHVFDRTPLTDMDELDSGHIDRKTVDFARVERCLHHPSNLVMVPALNLVILAGTPEVWRKLAANLLESGADDKLWAAVHIAKKLPESERLSMLYAHAMSAPRSGSQHVVDELTRDCLVDNPHRLESLRWALLSDQVEAAEAAAKWALSFPNVSSEIEAALLLEAFDHWRDIEKPYPKNGGSIPPSPRAQLLKALFQAGRTTFEMLVSWLGDTRTDVVETARRALIQQISIDSDARRKFVELALSRKLPLSTLKVAMADCRTYTEPECTKLLGLLDSEDANLRFVAMPLLDLSHVPTEQRAEKLETLRIDSEPQIREAAVRMIG